MHETRYDLRITRLLTFSQLKKIRKSIHAFTKKVKGRQSWLPSQVFQGSHVLGLFPKKEKVVILVTTTSFIWKRPIIITIFCLFLLSGCASLGPYTVNLADPPEYYIQNKINPFEGAELFEDNIVPIFYVTNREAYEEGEARYRFYKNKRLRGLNVGRAFVQFGKEETTWEELKSYMMDEGKRKKHKLRVIDVEEYGELNFARSRWDPKRDDPQDSAVDEKFIQEINDQLSKSKQKDITIFVHGFKVPFDDPVLVASQLAFYGGFEGVVMGFSWPSSQKMLGYFVDVEQTQYASRFLSFLVAFLAQSTNVEKINLIAHSSGSRVLSRTLTDISLLGGMGKTRNIEVVKNFKIGEVIFAGGDLSRDIMGVYLEYGIVEVPDKLVIYFSKTDKALGLSHWLWNMGRIGDLDLEKVDLTNPAIDYIKGATQFELIDATGTPGSEKQHGHVYFLTSQWVSSDVMLF